MKTEKTIIFGCPIYIIKVDPNSYDKQSLLKTIESNYSKDSYRNKFDKDQSNLHHSFSDELNPKFEKVDYNKVGLVDVYKKIFDNFCNNTLKTKDRFSYEYKIENYTASNKNQYFRSHHHLPTADFSSVHYIKFDKAQHEKTNFFNHNDFSSYSQFFSKGLYDVSDESVPENSYLFETWRFTVEEDDLVIFPAALKHEVPKGLTNTDKLRITVSTNLMINGPNRETK